MTLLKPRGNTLITPGSALDRGFVDVKRPKQQKIQTFPTMLKLISGTLVYSADSSDIYIEPGDEDEVNSCSKNDHEKGKEDNHNKKGTSLARNCTKSGKTQEDATG